VRRVLSLLFLPGIVIVVFAVGVAHSRYSSPSYAFGSQNSLWSYLGFAFLHALAAHTAGLPDESADMQPAFLASVVASGVATTGWLLVQTVSTKLLPRWVVLVAGIAVACWNFTLGGLSVLGRRQERKRDRVFAVLSAEDASVLEHDAATVFPRPEKAFGLVEVRTMPGRNAEQPLKIRDVGQEVGQQPDPHMVVPAGFGDLQSTIENADCSVIVLSELAARRDDIFHAASTLHRGGLKVRTLSDFYAEYFGKFPVSELSRMALLFDIRDRHNPVYRHVKRAIDIAGAALAGIAWVVVTPFVVLGNLAGNRGPLLFRQPRVGRHGDVFTILKFRTMRAADVTNPELAGSWTRIDDPRVTRFGRILRRTHLDELPQSWNILKGDLSLVGPRPEQPRYVEDLTAIEPAYEVRHYVTPGLTGWAQVKYRYAATEAAALEKLQYDLYYIAHQSLSLDFRILSRTVRSVLRRRGL
jgi:lipopolysaccharide/colanic/teichoic acid biosynthesis glycosyltransferase